MTPRPWSLTKKKAAPERSTTTSTTTMKKNKPVALMTVSAVVTQTDTDAIKKMADQGFDVVVVQDKDFEGAVKIMRKLSKQQAVMIPTRPALHKDRPKIKRSKTVTTRPCKCCGCKEIELYDCGYSSFNYGGGKCKGCGVKASGPVSTFPDKIELVSIWNTAQMPTREER